MKYSHSVSIMLLLSSVFFSLSYAGNYFFPDGDKHPAASPDEISINSDIEDIDTNGYKNELEQPFTGKGKFGNNYKGGNTFDRSGTYSGKVNPFGHAHDKSGNYSGRIDSFGNVYDRAGNYSGKVNPRP